MTALSGASASDGNFWKNNHLLHERNVFSSVASLMDEAGEEDGVDAGGDHSCWTLESNVLEVMMTGRGHGDCSVANVTYLGSLSWLWQLINSKPTCKDFIAHMSRRCRKFRT